MTVFTFKEAKILPLKKDEQGEIDEFTVKVYTEQDNIKEKIYKLSDVDKAEIEKGDTKLEEIILEQTEQTKEELITYLTETINGENWTVDVNGNYFLDKSGLPPQTVEPEEILKSDTITEEDLVAGEISEKPEPEPVIEDEPVPVEEEATIEPP